MLLATADRSAGLFVWEAAHAREYLNLQGHKAAITGISWRDDSNVLASVSEDGNLRCRNAGWKGNQKPGGPRWRGVCVSFAHDGRLVGAGRDLVPKLWDAGGNPVKQFAGFPEEVLHAVFTHDGKRIVAADWSGQVRVYNVADGKEVGRLAPNPPTLAMLVEQTAAKAAAAKIVADQAAAALRTASKVFQDKSVQAKAAADAAAFAMQSTQQADVKQSAATKAAADLAVPIKRATDEFNAAQLR